MDEKTRISVFELVDVASHLLGSTRLIKRYETVIENRAEDVSVLMNADRKHIIILLKTFIDALIDSLLLYLLDSAGQLFSRVLTIPAGLELVKADNKRQPNAAPVSRDMSLSLQLPQAIKELVSRSELPSPADETKSSPSDDDNTRLIGKLTLTSRIEGLRVHRFQEKVKAVAWDTSELVVGFLFFSPIFSVATAEAYCQVLDIGETSLSQCCTIPNEGISNFDWIYEDTIMIFYTVSHRNLVTNIQY